MFRNVYYNYSTNKIHLWETINDKRIYDKIDWVPYIYVPDKKGNISTIFGEKAKKIEFENYKKYKTFNENKEIKKFEDHVKPELQFLAERYYKISDDDIKAPELRIGSLDIEVQSDKGFPTPEEAAGVVTAISIDINNLITVFGIKPYTGIHKNNFVYCKSEKDLFKKFFKFINRADIDVLTGWNIIGFDLPYLYNRSHKLFYSKEKIFDQFSPINKINVWNRKDDNGLNIDITGISIIDYMLLYKQYTRKNPESYKLDDVAFEELNERKLEYDGTLNELYENDWEKYIDYNVQDVKLIWKLEQKLKYIELIQTISLLSKCPMKFYDKVTNVLEGVFLTYYRRNDLCAPKLKGGKVENFKAAYIKEPLKGLYQYTIDFDVTSEYPFVIMAGNISPETYFGCIRNLSEKDVIKYTRNRNFPICDLEKDTDTGREIKELKGKELNTFNKLLKNGMFSILPNGSIFKTNKQGVVPIVEKIFFEKRTMYKNKMKEADKNGESKEVVNRYNNYQLATKVGILNSLYGALSTPYFRLYNLRLAEAITAGGRHTIGTAENFLNKIMNKKSPEDFLKIEEVI